MSKQPMTVLERVQANVAIDPTTGCWLWKGALSQGYAYLNDGVKRSVPGHRALWIELHGPLERHQHVCHRCDVRRCVNPDHLFVGTHQDNMADMTAKGRQARGELHGSARLTSDQVRAIRADPRPLRQLAADYGVTPEQVSLIRRRLSWAHVPPMPTDARAHVRVKLTAQQILAIRADPRKQVQIAADYGVSDNCVSDIKRRVRWAHVPDADPPPPVACGV